MKKILYVFLAVILLTGCGEISNTPTKQVEGFFNQYQTLDEDVLDDLEQVITEEEKFNETSKEKYRDVIKKQYKNLTYYVKEEKVDGDTATVTVEITVYDFASVMSEAEDYKNNHMEEFNDESGNFSQSKYIDYVIEQLDKTKEKVKYTLDLGLTKINDKWKLDGLDSDTEDKILGIYEK